MHVHNNVQSPESVRVTLACRKNLSKTRAIMQSFLPRRAYRGSGTHLLSRLLVAGTVGVLVACGTDDPAGPDDSTGTENTPDASLLDLPGDGLEKTPDFDVNGPRELFERPDLGDALGAGSPRPARPPLSDAAPPDAGDDASDANGPI
jgi:hypothetical protein